MFFIILCDVLPFHERNSSLYYFTTEDAHVFGRPIWWKHWDKVFFFGYESFSFFVTNLFLFFHIHCSTNSLNKTWALWMAYTVLFWSISRYFVALLDCHLEIHCFHQLAEKKNSWLIHFSSGWCRCSNHWSYNSEQLLKHQTHAQVHPVFQLFPPGRFTCSRGICLGIVMTGACGQNCRIIQVENDMSLHSECLQRTAAELSKAKATLALHNQLGLCCIMIAHVITGRGVIQEFMSYQICCMVILYPNAFS